MNLFNFFANRHERNRNPEDTKLFNGKKLNIYALVNWISIIGIFVLVGIMVLGFLKVYPMTAGPITSMAVILILLLGCSLSLPWIKRLQKKENKILSIVFLCLIGVCVVLWIVAAVMLYIIYKKGGTNLGSAIRVIQASLIISIQFIIAQLLTTMTLQYKKSLILLQVVAYISHLFIDFYITWAVCCLTAVKEGLEINTNALGFLGTPVMIGLFGLLLTYAIISRAILSSISRRRAKTSVVVGDDGSVTTITNTVEPQKAETPKTEPPKAEPPKAETPKAETPKAEPPKAEKSAKTRLEELKSMLDQGLITQEEFDAKKEEILKEM